MEYAKSSRSACRMCEEKITKDELRVAAYKPSESNPQMGDVPKWYVFAFVRVSYFYVCAVLYLDREREQGSRYLFLIP